MRFSFTSPTCRSTSGNFHMENVFLSPRYRYGEWSVKTKIRLNKQSPEKEGKMRLSSSYFKAQASETLSREFRSDGRTRNWNWWISTFILYAKRKFRHVIFFIRHVSLSRGACGRFSSTQDSHYEKSFLFVSLHFGFMQIPMSQPTMWVTTK